ncbi:hypothetical protein [Sporosarcina sp. FA9]|uniref:hypothetical protein n=1 Tax=Sporosarcina sp. FA9 TaxID=3413030 RepID=UPI003F65F697
MKTQRIPDDVKAAMWQFFLKTSVPRLIEQKRKEQAKLEALAEIDEVKDEMDND